MSAAGDALRDACVNDPALARWELNPITRTYTKRCVRCGRVLVTVTQRELNAAKIVLPGAMVAGSILDEFAANDLKATHT